MNVALRGLGLGVPRYSIAQADAAGVARTFVYQNAQAEKILPLLHRLSQVQRRGSVLLERPEGDEPRHSFYWQARSEEDRGPSTSARLERFAQEATPLAIAACRRALDEAAADAGEITHLITVSCTGFFAPGVEFALIHDLGLPPTVARVNVGFMGCHGALNALRVAQAFIAADPTARVLLCCVELCSLHYQYGWDQERVVANTLFADGAAACVLAAEAEHRPEAWKLAACGSRLLPDSHREMTWRITDHGFAMTLSARVPELIRQHLKSWLQEWLGEQGLRVEDIASWAIHPGGPRVVQAALESLNLPASAAEASSAVLGEHGNMSSATVLFVLRRLQQMGAAPPCVALAFGPGLTAEAALFC
ncbi:MAG: type III polyketide synthase [Planctomycetes bacterium]|nr:type III polyketide synthase [Planctomycetota bacterium]